MGIAAESPVLPLSDHAGVLVGQERGQPPVHRRQLGFHDGNVHVLTYSLAVIRVAGQEQGPQSCHRRGGAGLVQSRVGPQPYWLSFRQPRRGHLSAHGVKDDVRPLIVPVRARLAEIGNGRHHQSRVERLQGRMVQPERRHGPGAEAFHDEVGLRDQFAGDVPAWLSGEVQGYAALVGVQVKEQAAFFGMGSIAGKGAQPTGHISDSGPFHLDDVGPLVGHQLGAIRAGQVLGEV